ncbi:MAG: hypothetical protein ACPGU4_09085 [Flavobacteriales bacterium]
MKNPKSVYRYMFIASMGFFLVGILFTITKTPAAELFSVLGGISLLAFYSLLSNASEKKSKAVYARHAAVVFLIVGQTIKSFGITAGSYLLLIAFVAVLVWITWSVLEGLPPSEKED